MKATIHNLEQGSEAWRALRTECDTASEAPAALGKSKYVSRTALLQQKASGIERDIDSPTQALFNRGHESEAAARPHAEKITDADLYPITATVEIDGLKLLASLDGATLDGELIWEHKLWSQSLAADVTAGTLAEHYTIQMDQQLLVTGAKKCLFMVSDGTEEKMVWCWYESNQEKFDALIAGWQQFRIDLAAHVPAEVVVPAVAAPQAALPAVFVQVSGGVAVSDNLNAFGDALKAYVERINRKPETDQDFADLEATVKTLKTAEEALDAAESGALAQTESIDLMRRMVAEYRELARSNRLVAEKVVKAEKENRRNTIVQKGKDAFAAHIEALNQRLGKPYMPPVPADFAGVVKGLKTMSSIQNAVDTELARAKISANQFADMIQVNLTTLRELAKDHAFLFADAAQIVLKAPDDLTALVKLRIAEHKAAEEKRLADERARIAEEERVKAEAATKAEADRVLKAKQDEFDAQVRAEREQIAARQSAVLEAAQTQRATEAPSVALYGGMPGETLGDMKIAADRPTPTLKLGEINARIAPLSITADGLRQLGFEHAGRERSAILYHETDWPHICDALIVHIQLKVGPQRQAA